VTTVTIYLRLDNFYYYIELLSKYLTNITPLPIRPSKMTAAIYRADRSRARGSLDQPNAGTFLSNRLHFPCVLSQLQMLGYIYEDFASRSNLTLNCP
jgi:hypothetical protein